MHDAGANGRLIAGSAWFHVIEEPVYTPSGAGEHLYVEIEKEGLTTDAVVEALAKVCGKRPRDIGFAGRKDRHAVTRQWFSVHFGDEARLAALPDASPRGRITVTATGRHGNKIRLGHLAGNRFRLGLADVRREALTASLAVLAQEGIRNRFGPQRFGVHGATLAIARAWGRGDHDGAIALIVDPSGAWRVGDAIPTGFRSGPEGSVFAALRRGALPAAALSAAGDPMRKLAASAAQSAVFNAVLDARAAAGILHRFRVGDLGLTVRGAPFAVTAEELESTNQRAAPGVLDAFTSGPLPGTRRLAPSPEVEVEERAWSAACGVDWSWMGDGGVFESPGERRASVTPFRSPPILSESDGTTWLEFSLGSGSYATEVLAQAGISVPTDRRTSDGNVATF
ncbi:MAG: tRNA pseudouridine(13) synthase TruD [Planctomycetes bacterium]|nr:tRNA pseudouridine(13) synthase TruD [Planctomycetota bacterium]